MALTPPPTRATPADGSDSAGHSGFAARISLGRVFTPVPSEFLLIASAALILTLFGLTMVLSATMADSVAAGEGPFEVVLKQGIFVLLGVPVMFILSRVPVAFYKKISWIALIGALGLQLLVFTPLGVVNDGNRNWIIIAGQQLQPSEFLKLAFALWLGYVLFRKQTLLGLWRHVFIPVIPVSALVIGSVIAGKDLGTAMVLVLILLGALFFSGVKLRVFIIPLILAAAAVAFLATSADRVRRITSFLFEDCLQDHLSINCFQPLHGVWGLAGGGVFGVGLGNSREKYWLPAASHDYIFAILGEELGLIGCLVVLALFMLFAVGAFHIIRKTHDPFVRIAAGGITVWIVGQALINIGVVLRVLPVLGIPLPFMSQGGTSMIAVLLACGVLLAFARSLGQEEPAPVAVRRPAPPRSAR